MNTKQEEFVMTAIGGIILFVIIFFVPQWILWGQNPFEVCSTLWKRSIINGEFDLILLLLGFLLKVTVSLLVWTIFALVIQILGGPFGLNLNLGE